MLDEAEHSRRTGLALMRMTLALIDRAGESVGAARVQQAIDVVESRVGDHRVGWDERASEAGGG